MKNGCDWGKEIEEKRQEIIKRLLERYEKEERERMEKLKNKGKKK